MRLPAPASPPAGQPVCPLVSVIVVNYNCLKWLDRFFPSLEQQTIFSRVEIIMVDNTSKDGSAAICEKKMASLPNGVFLQTGGNYGFGGGSNRGAKIARGKYLFFLNPDVWLENNCLEELCSRAEAIPARVGCPKVLDYDTDAIQTQGSSGFDLFGNVVPVKPDEAPERLFSVGTFFFFERQLFEKLGGFDEEFFLYNEEMDLSWRAWLADEPVVLFYTARIHHQAVSSGNRFVETRTSETRRFYSNRNQLLTLLKNVRGPLLILVLTQLALIAAEAAAGVIVSRRLSFVRWALLKPLAECWRLRGHLGQQRRRNRDLRRHGDAWFVRHFFRFAFGRMNDLKNLLHGRVKIDPPK
ncbi:MAG TPA: glycosyltransferase family 2 protein [Verrucomicrobiae bacterium]|nr:glycosyltransferase family 2 protein [Verrucomicrobiae bacterium]